MKCVVDHIVYNASDLEGGIAAVERLTGVRATVGGRHTGLGTHNALLSLGDGTYLEIISGDGSGIRPWPFRLYDSSTHGKLSAFAVRPLEGSIEEHRAALGAGEVGGMERRRPDGTLLRWQMTPGPGAPGHEDGPGGGEPWIIDWGASPHPSSSAPSGCRLARLEIVDPRGASLEATLKGTMGLTTPVEFAVGEPASVVAVIESPNGIVRL